MSTQLPYGQFKLNGKMKKAHRVAWELGHGEVPKGLMVLHECDNPTCVRPSHLFLGTHEDNMRDMVKKGRPATGIRNGRNNVKLTEEEVKEIRADTRTQREIAESFNVCQMTVCKIKNRTTWKHIPEEIDNDSVKQR